MGYPIDHPFNDGFPMEAMKAEEPEHYRTERAAAQAHELIENLSRPKKREAPVEVTQAHMIGSLESDVKHLQRECEMQYRRANEAESKLAEALQRAEQYQKEYNEWRSSALKAEARANKAEELHKNLLAKRRRGY